MKQRNFTSIRAALDRLQSLIPEEYYDEDEMIEWMGHASRKINAYPQYEEAITLLQVENYTACLPKGLLQIQMVAYKVDDSLTDSELDDIKEIIQHNKESYYRGFIGSNFFINNFRPLRLSTTPFAKQIHCKECENLVVEDEHRYSVDPYGNIMTTFKSGPICISYLKQPMDEYGEFLIPDDRDYIDALVNFCLLNMWEKRFNRKEQGSQAMLEYYSSKWEIAYPKAKGKLMMPDIDTLENIRVNNNRLIPKEGQYSNFFGFLGEREATRYL